MSGRVFLDLTSTKQGIKWLAPGHNAVRLVRFKPAILQSGVKHSTNEPPHSSWSLSDSKLFTKPGYQQKQKKVAASKDIVKGVTIDKIFLYLLYL